jgi:hypothetical protein
MRQITIDAIRAFRNGTNFKRGNTQVRLFENANGDDLRQLRLHGNVIAEYVADGSLWITSANWETVTTKERLNGLPNVHIVQRDFQWFLNGEPWDGQYVKV